MCWWNGTGINTFEEALSLDNCQMLLFIRMSTTAPSHSEALAPFHLRHSLLWKPRPLRSFPSLAGDMYSDALSVLFCDAALG
jgi:hypothetical protein